MSGLGCSVVRCARGVIDVSASASTHTAARLGAHATPSTAWWLRTSLSKAKSMRRPQPFEYCRFSTEQFPGIKSEELRADAPILAPFVSALQTCARDMRWQQALWTLLEDMPEQSVVPDVYCLGITLNACASGSATRCALDLYGNSRHFGIQPNSVVANTVIQACSRAALWEGALHMLKDMRTTDVEINVIGFTAAATACKRGGHWQRAMQVFQQMHAVAAVPNLVAYNAAISVCEKGRQWVHAIRLLRQMRLGCVPVDASCSALAISACAGAGLWEAALFFIVEAGKEATQINRIAINAFASACEKGHAWRWALHSLDQMRDLGLGSNVESLRASMRACVASGQLPFTPALHLRRCIGLSVLGRSLVCRDAVGAGSRLRGEIIAAASKLKGFGLLDSSSGAVVWQHLQRIISSRLQTLSPIRQDCSIGKLGESGDGSPLLQDWSDRLHDMHVPDLQDLFEIGSLCARDALACEIAIDCPYNGVANKDWREFARTELYITLLEAHRWFPKDAPIGRHLATWCESRLESPNEVAVAM